MSTIVKRNVIKREKGYLYFINKKGDVLKAKMRKGGKKGRRSCTHKNKRR